MDKSRLAFRAALATDLLTFLERAFREIDPRGALHVGDYVLYLIEALQRVAEGNDTRVILNLPPRHLKSILASIVWPAWLLGRIPKRRIAVVSHSQALARDLSLKTLRLMETDFYRDVFPQTHLRDDRRQAMDFETSQSGGRYGASFETGITGRGFDLIIVDDPISAHANGSSSTDTAEDAILRHAGQCPLRDSFQIVRIVRHNQDDPIEFAVYDDLGDTFGERGV